MNFGEKYRLTKNNSRIYKDKKIYTEKDCRVKINTVGYGSDGNYVYFTDLKDKSVHRSKIRYVMKYDGKIYDVTFEPDSKEFVYSYITYKNRRILVDKK